MRILPVLCALAATLPAAPDTGRSKLHEIETRERAFWDAYPKRRVEAQRLWMTPIQRAHTEPGYPQDARPDYSGLHSMYDDYDALQKGRGEAYLELARSEGPKAAEMLLDELLDTAKRIDELEAAILEMKAGSRQDLRPGIERFGLDTREKGLERALAACPGAPAFLGGPAWAAAEKRDGKKSFERRIAVLDALGMTRDPVATPFLAGVAKAPASSLRIAALEALLGLGPDAMEALVPILGDRSPVVRIALLQAIRARDAANRAWIAPVLASYAPSARRLRAEHVATLEALSGRTYGDDPDRWAAWAKKLEENGGPGKAELEKIDVEASAKPGAARETARFYGLSTTSDRVVFVLQGSNILRLPADADVQAKRAATKWGPKTKGAWEDGWADHVTVVRRELMNGIAGMAADVRFAVVVMRQNSALDTAGADGLLKPDGRGRNETEKLLDRLPGDPNQLGPWDGLLGAMRIAGLDPDPPRGDFPEMKVDTAFLLDQGTPADGAYATADSTVRAFVRLNRFRRLTVHAVRICIADKEEETLMRGIAEGSGGTYKWQKKPP